MFKWMDGQMNYRNKHSETRQKYATMKQQQNNWYKVTKQSVEKIIISLSAVSIPWLVWREKSLQAKGFQGELDI